MTQFYNDILSKSGVHKPGACRIQVVPITALSQNIKVNPQKGTVTQAVQLKTGWNFINIDFVDNTFQYDCKRATTKGNPYYTITASATNNSNDSNNISTMDTLRFIPLVVLITNRDGSVYIIGNKEAGAKLSFNQSNEGKSGGANAIPFTLSLDSPNPPYFYTI